jgi:hypothetical protein
MISQNQRGRLLTFSEVSDRAMLLPPYDSNSCLDRSPSSLPHLAFYSRLGGQDIGLRITGSARSQWSLSHARQSPLCLVPGPLSSILRATTRTRDIKSCAAKQRPYRAFNCCSTFASGSSSDLAICSCTVMR